VDRLVARKLVRREQDPGDRRVWRAALTERGRALWQRLESELLDIDRNVLRMLTPSEREALIRAMAQLSSATAAWRARAAVGPTMPA
jgi:DNA-binding MarR family transcriptional regulator